MQPLNEWLFRRQRKFTSGCFAASHCLSTAQGAANYAIPSCLTCECGSRPTLHTHGRGVPARCGCRCRELPLAASPNEGKGMQPSLWL
jgi:hypothetical protein